MSGRQPANRGHRCSPERSVIATFTAIDSQGRAGKAGAVQPPPPQPPPPPPSAVRAEHRRVYERRCSARGGSDVYRAPRGQVWRVYRDGEPGRSHAHLTAHLRNTLYCAGPGSYRPHQRQQRQVYPCARPGGGRRGHIADTSRTDRGQVGPVPGRTDDVWSPTSHGTLPTTRDKPDVRVHSL